MISFEPTQATKELVTLLKNSGKIMTDAKKSALTQAAIIFSSQSKQKAPRGTGNLSRNIKYEVANDGSQARVYNELEYAAYQEEGTGIYGKYKTPVVPRRAKYLRFKSKTGQIVYAKSVRGVKPTWFMRQGKEFLDKNWNKVKETLYNEIVKRIL
jgi:HK97 gp10 family phage protein